MKANEVMKLLNITRSTLYRYRKLGKVKIDAKISFNNFIYNDDSVYALIGIKKLKRNRKIISYSRVSTSNQKDQLKEQTKRIYDSCIVRGLILDQQIEDIKSGMSSNREGFQKIIQMVIKGLVELLVIENKDRLIRFGYETIEQIFKYFGTKILVLNDVLLNKTYEQELTEDLISIIHYFSMKNYSHRRKLNKLRKLIEENNK